MSPAARQSRHVTSGEQVQLAQRARYKSLPLLRRCQLGMHALKIQSTFKRFMQNCRLNQQQIKRNERLMPLFELFYS